MRHGKKVNHLGRKSAHRKAMLANMACSLIEHKRINTTVAKAKALKQFIEPLITKSKAENNQTTEKGTHNRRIAFKNLRDKYAVTELFGSVSDKVGDRAGGYTRIIKLGNRLGDNADMAMIELVDFNELYNAGKPAKKKTTRRSRRGKKAEAVTAEATQETAVAEEPQEEVVTEVKEVETAEAKEVEEVKETESAAEEVKETEEGSEDTKEKKNDPKE
ncbi:50S ribosomal protein L17 [uncultured Eudoraea sp.]|uniref:50S ribosomal protein L17 n=1 Tax=uncultured Eudoraea sp. TaxID=1035614 RepID=UPI00260BD819|nr:50S ribosomal protein L17 [uncultured Eudoraea sp.]